MTLVNKSQDDQLNDINYILELKHNIFKNYDKLLEPYINDNKIIKVGNEYQFHGKQGNRIIFSDKILPFENKMPIPFSFPVYLI